MAEESLCPAPPFSYVLERRLSRREALRAGAAVAAGVAIGPLVARGSAAAPARERTSGSTGLGFTPVDPGSSDEIVVPDGYEANVLISWGDPLRPGLPAFDIRNQTAESQQQRFGFSNDFVAFFPLPQGRGLLWVNHEFSLERLMFPDWDPENPSKEQVDIALASVGGTVVEVGRRPDGRWTYDWSSRFNRRITATTPTILSGPAAGSRYVCTEADPGGRQVLGTFANCAGGVTPWGTVLSAEENFDDFFDFSGIKEGKSLAWKAHREYTKKDDGGAERGWHRYERRFNPGKEPHEPFRFGWVVEIDPYDPDSVPRKRTALGRFKHEGATTTVARDGRVAVYSGEDEEFQYIYKFVSTGRFDPHDRLANRNLLDNGTLYAARFYDDGTGVWLPLVFGSEGLGEGEFFTSQADVLVLARVAAKAVRATPMDRAEDVEINPLDGHVYVALTKNQDRDSEQEWDRANPRWPNSLGHVIEIIEDGDDAAATSFRWEIFLLCGHPSQLVTDLATDDFRETGAKDTSYFAGYRDPAGLSPISNPDNLLFDRAGNLWIATDGQVETLGCNDSLHAVPTRGPERGRVQQFLRAVNGAEVTGPCLTPANDTLFVSIQHPGRTDHSDLATATSHWPDGDRNAPRPSVVVVTKKDGGIIGS
jgi:secreted PhoX family phosphatase